MTAEQINAMEAGLEMGMAVAEACAITAATSLDGGLGVVRQQGDGLWTTFSPSTDWNDAMLAAERFGLFDPAMWGTALSQDGAGGPRWWWVFDVTEWGLGKGDDATFAEAATGPLAICRAILKLHHQ